MARLSFFALYCVAFIAGGFGNWSTPVMVTIYVIVSVLWIVLLGIYVRDLHRAVDRWRYARSHLSIPLLLIAPLFLLLYWDPVWFVLVIAAYILELREHSAGNGFTFSFYLIIFVGVLASLTMVELENDVPGSQFAGPVDALYWAFGGLLKINTGRTLAPSTPDGQFLVLVIGVCGVLAASMFTAKLVTWVIGDEVKAAELDLDDGLDDGATSMRADITVLQAQVARLAQETKDDDA